MGQNRRPRRFVFSTHFLYWRLYKLYNTIIRVSWFDDDSITDSHSLMKYFIRRLKDNGGNVVYNVVYKSNVIGLRKISEGYEVTIIVSSGGNFRFRTRIAINSAGLKSDHIAEMIGIDTRKENYCLKYCKG